MKLLAVLALLPLEFAVLHQTQAQTLATTQWRSTGEFDDVTRYVDDIHIVRGGDHAVIWKLQDFNITSHFGTNNVYSIRYEVEYNCHRQLRRRLYYEMYSGHMAQGSLVAMSYPDEKWAHVTTGSGLQVACGPANTSQTR
jgi:endo-1,4-beta-mannosidase